MEWGEIFEKELKKEHSMLAYYTTTLIHNWYFLYKIRQYLNPGDSILETGTGRGFLAIYLASLGYKVTAMDLDTSFIKKANSYFNSSVNILQGDLEKPASKYDLIYNVGVMEHFTDSDIIRILENFRQSTGILIFSVPNFKVDSSIGNERYLSKRKWKKLIQKGAWEPIEIFSYTSYKWRKYFTGFVCKGI